MNRIETWELPLFWILGISQVAGPTMLFMASVRGIVRNRPMTCEKNGKKTLLMASVHIVSKRKSTGIHLDQTEIGRQ